ncbi:helix-turn-helix domain-containing protein [Persicimonas caeni]|uniref:Helix-turn-helix domain-containing protein n=1 Tax=Persicimonas caeni TaxID=2292766 RepID=A0A4Y6PP43_PERCE|nr:helix-turn-helix transcriptional regulator [Persicimonas caeni]QDG49575.1 helix-turn-helix domain-containing protein [Persicimonas caeni]QED30796.1 helix-turn-helix domain-containing protein [Persicimonas caeni]
MWLFGRKKQTEDAPTLAELFREARARHGMSRKECAHAAGYQNVTKGCRRLCEIERGEADFPDERVLARFATALDIDDEEVRRAQRVEIARHDAPTDPEILVQWAPKIVAPLECSSKLSRRKALKVASNFARKNHKDVVVCLSELRRVYIDPNGARTETLEVPWSSLEGELPDVPVRAVA